MRMDPVLVTLAFYRVAKVVWSSSSGSDDFLSYYFVTGTVQGYRAEWIGPVKRQRVVDGPEVPDIAPVVDVNWLPGVARKTISKVEHD